MSLSKTLTTVAAAAICLLAAAFTATAQSREYRELWNDPAVANRIEEGILRNRTSWFTLEVTGKNGDPMPGVAIELEQASHEFLFGANAFMAGGFDSAAANKRYEETFASLFNFATIPFYWKTLEPEPGRIRFAANSAPVYRRPPPDAVLDFCRRYNLTPKGHPLVWDNPQWQVPDWLPEDRDELARLHRRRIEQIAGRYRDSIFIWDVVNEYLSRKPEIPMPDDFVRFSFDIANRHFPPETELILNETTGVWRRFEEERSPFYLVVENLLLRGVKIDAIGIQLHYFSEQFWEETLAGKAMRPLDIYRVLDRYADFGLPLHITEITIPTLPDAGAEAQAVQAEVVRNLYRIWYSHPAVEAITWWNLLDGTAVPGEDKWRGGLYRGDFTPKTSAKVLDQLINHEWHTTETVTTDSAGRARIRATHGIYAATINGVRRTIRLTSDSPRTIILGLAE